MTTPNYAPETNAIHGGWDGHDDPTGSCAVPIYATASYLFNDTDHAASLFALTAFGNIYTRLMNPTVDVLEKRLAAMEGGVTGLGFASGMGAITAVIATLAKQGQNIVAAKSLYGGTITLLTHTLSRFGIETRFFDASQPEAARDLIDENTRCLYIETISNPDNCVADFAVCSRIAKDAAIPLVCDNTVAPYICRPIEHGVDIVIYSTTKYINGQGTHVGGMIIDAGTFDWAADSDKWPDFTTPDPSYHGVVFTDALKPLGNIALNVYIRTHWLRDTGACMSPFGAWATLQGLETLPLRMEKHAANALEMAKWLDAHPAVTWVNYPGLPSHRSHDRAKQYVSTAGGGMIGFGIKGGREAGAKFINAVKLARHLANIGDAKTLVIHPASTTHQQLTDEEQRAGGISPEFIRLSVGIEAIADIQADFDQALQASQQS